MKVLKLIILCYVVLFLLGSTTMMNADEPKVTGSKNVMIAPNAIGIPLDRILLVRKKNEYCAVKFTQCGTGKTDYEQHAEYESYYQGDNTGNFKDKNVKFRKEDVYYTKPSFSFLGHPVRIGAKRDIRCGSIELWWSGLHCTIAVYFNRHDQKQGDFYGIELAPTPWTDIKDVNVFDPRIKWYRYNKNRKDVYIPIDKLWEEKK